MELFVVVQANKLIPKIVAALNIILFILQCLITMQKCSEL